MEYSTQTQTQSWYESEEGAFVNEDEQPDVSHTKDMLEGLIDAVYNTANIASIEFCLEELSSQFGIKIPRKAPVLEETREETRDVYITKHKEGTKTITDYVNFSGKKTKHANAIDEMKEVRATFHMIRKSPQYKKMGSDVIFAIVEKALSIGINPIKVLIVAKKKYDEQKSDLPILS